MAPSFVLPAAAGILADQQGAARLPVVARCVPASDELKNREAAKSDMLRTPVSRAALVALLLLSQTPWLSGQSTSPALPTSTPPADFLGHSVGADFRLAGWDTITAYFNHLGDSSPFVRVDTLGRSTLGRPFVLAVVSAPENLSRLSQIQIAQAKLADPRRLEPGELDELLAAQPAVVLIAHNIHGTEIASSQGVMELAYSLAVEPELQALLQDVVVLLIPSVNPDGQQIVVDWYRETVGTPFEGSGMPWLYHHYVGHDNNRDFFMLTQVETGLVNDLLYGRWFPEVVYDVHQMGNRGARLFVPPFDDPANPNLDPLAIRQISLFGLQISTDLEAAGKAGVVNSQRFDLWWHGGLRTVPARHNMIGLLSESASARLASPIFQDIDDLRQPERGSNYPNPWPGGWWRIRDIIDYQLIAARSVIGLAARHRRQLITNFVELGRRAITAGEQEPPFAYIVPAKQRDPGSAATMLETLRRGGVEIHRASSAFQADGIDYSRGDWVVLMAQPYRAHAKDLLEHQSYPDRRLFAGGPPDTPYDVAGWTLPLQMGVKAIAVQMPFQAELPPVLSQVRPPPGRVNGPGPAFLLDNVTNAANLAINRTLQANGRVTLLTEPLQIAGRSWPAGAALLQGEGIRDLLDDLAAEHGLVAESFTGSFAGFQIDSLRLGLYQPWTASMDEGWTRWVLDTWGIHYQTLHDAEIRAGDLTARYDVIIIPDASPSSIVEGRKPGTVPAEYAGGLADQGIAAIRSFVNAGGTLICLDSSSGFAIQHLDLPVKDVRPPSEEQPSGDAFYAPGSILAINIDARHPVGFGMPEESAIYYANGPVFEVDEKNNDVAVVARYPESGQLLSGYALNADFLAGRAALVEAEHGDGRVILFGFRPQHRGQTHESFKLLFNAIYRGAAHGPVTAQLP
ncbi:MAG: peptidase M14 [Gemmatimonadota bacterium]|nr:MAG: peptidase M14 [Gemmatimonadota bacterium]